MYLCAAGLLCAWSPPASPLGAASPPVLPWSVDLSPVAAPPAAEHSLQAIAPMQMVQFPSPVLCGLRFSKGGRWKACFAHPGTCVEDTELNNLHARCPCTSPREDLTLSQDIL
jgi:hypothetical protein